MIEPHATFEFVTPDTVAECMLHSGNDPDGALAAKLWDLVSEYRCRPDAEYPEERWVDSLKRFWNRFTPEEQRRLNAAAEDED